MVGGWLTDITRADVARVPGKGMIRINVFVGRLLFVLNGYVTVRCLQGPWSKESTDESRESNIVDGWCETTADELLIV